MDIQIVFSQMCVIILIILMGYFAFRKSIVDDNASRRISGLVVNFCNPAMLICSAFEAGPRASSSVLLTAAAATLLLYAILLAAGFLLPRLLRIPKESHYEYYFLTVYGNVGFLGIPLVSAVLGSSALIFVSINCLVYNILFYSTGVSKIRRQAGKAQAASNGRELFGMLINVGTVSAALTIFFYLGDFKVPMVLRDTLSYTGRATTFLSMLVLGVSVAQMPLRQIFGHGRDYLFVALRMLALPILCVLLLRRFLTDPMLLNTLTLLIAVPAGNLPLMCSKENGLSPNAMARNIILTTLLSAVTIPLVVLFL